MCGEVGRVGWGMEMRCHVPRAALVVCVQVYQRRPLHAVPAYQPLWVSLEAHESVPCASCLPSCAPGGHGEGGSQPISCISWLSACPHACPPSLGACAPPSLPPSLPCPILPCWPNPPAVSATPAALGVRTFWSSQMTSSTPTSSPLGPTSRARAPGSWVRAWGGLKRGALLAEACPCPSPVHRTRGECDGSQSLTHPRVANPSPTRVTPTPQPPS